MKKDFETAYKELANTEVPDLWDRIEAGLSEKSAPAETKAEKNKKTAPVNKKTKIAVFMRKYSALAAAIVCAVILIPTMIVMKKSDSKFMSESAYDEKAVAEEAGAASMMTEEASVETEAVAEVAEMELSVDGGLSNMIERIVNSKDNKEIIALFKQIILKAYGEKSPDGKRFVKSKEISEAFSQTEAYSELFVELALNEEKAANFIKGILPLDL